MKASLLFIGLEIILLISSCSAWGQTPTPPIQPATPALTATPVPASPTPTPTASPTPVLPVIYYVPPSGNDADPGTLERPLRTIQQAVNMVRAGDTIILRAGTYLERVKIMRSGTASLPITLTAYQGETATIDGGENIALVTAGPVSYWIIAGLRFQSTNKHTLRFGWFLEAITDHITLRNNYIKGAVFTVGHNQLFENNEMDGSGYTDRDGYGGINDSHGDLGDEATHHNIYRNNFIHDFTNFNARGIWTQGRTHDNIIEFNRIENIWSSGLGQCIDLDAGQTGLVQWRQIVRNNTVTDCSYVGIQLENVFEGLVENNLISAEKGGNAGLILINYSASVGCGVGGEENQFGDTNGDASCVGDLTNTIIRQNVIAARKTWAWGYGGVVNWGVGGVSILSNTIYAPGSAGNAAINFQSTVDEASQAVIQNNILYNGNGSAICALNYDSFVRDDHNLLYKTNLDMVYGRGKNCYGALSLIDYSVATGKGQNSLQTDPQFVNASLRDFHLLSTSPAIDAGLDLGLSADLEGLARPKGLGFDLGAYEFAGP